MMRRMTMAVCNPCLAGAALALCLAGPAFADPWYPYEAVQITPPFSADGAAAPVKYSPLAKAEKPINICVSFPHMKDAYWLGVDYGVAEEAKDLGVVTHITE